MLIKSHVNQLKDIPEAKAVEQAFVAGYWAVVQKGKYKVGDPVDFLPEDSVILEHVDGFNFLGNIKEIPVEDPNNEELFEKVRGRKVSAKRVLQVISQGLVVDPGILKESDIRKYSPEAKFAMSSSKGSSCGIWGRTLGHRPSWLLKTDSENVQRTISTLSPEEARDWLERVLRCGPTLKLDGSSITVTMSVKDGKVSVYSRTLEREATHLRNGLFERVGAENILRGIEKFYGDWWGDGFNVKAGDRHPEIVGFHGELMGPKFNGNREQFFREELFVYRVFYKVRESVYYNPPEDIEKLKEYIPELSDLWVPEISKHSVTVEHVLDNKELTLKSFNQSIPAEGVVFYNPDDPQGFETYKFINPLYLLGKR